MKLRNRQRCGSSFLVVSAHFDGSGFILFFCKEYTYIRKKFAYLLTSPENS